MVPGAQAPAWWVPDPGNPSGPAIGPLRVALLLGTVAALVTAVVSLLLLATAPERDAAFTSGTSGTSGIPGPKRPGALALAPAVGPGGPGVALTAAVESAPPPPPYVQPVEPLAKSAPTRLVIHDIGVDAPLRAVGLTPNGEIEVPPLSARNLAGWYQYGPTPGELGPAVIVGHVNTRSGPAVFMRLRELAQGDTVQIGRRDGTVAVFTVDGVEQVSKKAFPTERVYGNTDHAALRLITCGGVYNRKTHSYTDNLVVYASLSSVKSP
ncbi:class F sortase [Planotetraspora sp. GP83]|uniref:class F sortase n=1 Tax=Planotetraspora sp. GP83 TaxID=3156264 RepID=UPI003515ACA1